LLDFLESASLDDSDSDSLLHVPNGETAKRGEFREDFTRHRLGRFHGDNTGIT